MLPDGIRRLFRLGRGAKDVAPDVDAELRFHLEAKIAALVGHGMSLSAAREEALRQLGDLGATKAALEAIDRREAVAGGRREWLGGWWLDVRHAVWSLRRTPGVTAAVIVMLALGIGANAAMFDILDRLFLRPPAGVEKPEEVLRLYARFKLFDGRVVTSDLFDVQDYDALRTVRGFEGLAGYWRSTRNLGRGQNAARASVSVVTADYFGLLGVRPPLGRLIGPADDLETATPAAVVSHAYWRSRLGGMSEVLDSSLSLDGVRYRIVGVAPEGFGGLDPSATDVWVPARVAGPAERGPNWRLTRRGGLSVMLLARLTRDIVPATVAERATVVLRGNAATSIQQDPKIEALTGPIIRNRGPGQVDQLARLPLLVGGVVAVILLITAANVTTLMLLRAARRRRELAVRAALGAGRWRIMRFTVTEGVILALAAGAVATGVCAFASRLLRLTLLPRYQWTSGPLDLRVLAFAGAAALILGLASSFVPALQSASSRLDDLRAHARASRAGHSRVRAGLLTLQSALSLTLLVGAALFYRSLSDARDRDVGFDLAKLVVVDLRNVSGQDATPIPESAVNEMEQRLRRIPGVSDVAVQARSVLMRMWGGFQIRVPGVDSLSREALDYSASGVSPNFMDVTGLRMVRGRGFSSSDRAGAAKVAVVNERMAQLVWRGAEPLGQCFYIQPGPAECRTVVGVVENAHENTVMQTRPHAQYYLPLEQTPGKEHSRALVVRAVGDPDALVVPTRQAMADLFPDLPGDRVSALIDVLAARVRSWRIGTGLFAAAAGLALLLAAIGLYSVIAFGVRQREHEFGIRRALGADTSHLMRLVLGQGFALAVAGIVLGTALAAWGGKFIKPLLFQGREPHDPVAFGVAAAVLLLAALAAALIPALQAARVDPRQALQAE